MLQTTHSLTFLHWNKPCWKQYILFLKDIDFIPFFFFFFFSFLPFDLLLVIYSPYKAVPVVPFDLLLAIYSPYKAVPVRAFWPFISHLFAL